MGCSPPGSSVHGILQARTLEWAPLSSSGDLPDPGIEPRSPWAILSHQGSPIISHVEFSKQISDLLPFWGFLCGLVVKNLPANAGDESLIPVGKIPWRMKLQPTPVLSPGASRGRRSLVGHTACSHRELDTTEPLSVKAFLSLAALPALCIAEVPKGGAFGQQDPGGRSLLSALGKKRAFPGGARSIGPHRVRHD